MTNKIEKKEVEEVKVLSSEETAETAEVEEVAVGKEFLLHREKFTNMDGKTYWGYFVPLKLGIKEFKANFKPKDIGGYALMEMLFELSPDEVTLHIFERKMRDSVTGRTSKYTVYKAMAFYNGVPQECSMKVANSSDESILVNWINLNKAKDGAK